MKKWLIGGAMCAMVSGIGFAKDTPEEHISNMLQSKQVCDVLFKYSFTLGCLNFGDEGTMDVCDVYELGSFCNEKNYPGIVVGMAVQTEALCGEKTRTPKEIIVNQIIKAQINTTLNGFCIPIVYDNQTFKTACGDRHKPDYCESDGDATSKLEKPG